MVEVNAGLSLFGFSIQMAGQEPGLVQFCALDLVGQGSCTSMGEGHTREHRID